MKIATKADVEFCAFCISIGKSPFGIQDRGPVENWLAAEKWLRWAGYTVETSEALRG